MDNQTIRFDYVDDIPPIVTTVSKVTEWKELGANGVARCGFAESPDNVLYVVMQDEDCGTWYAIPVRPYWYWENFSEDERI